MATPATLYEYYTGKGQALPSLAARAPLYQSYGLGSAGSYTGTAAQNTALLGKLLSGAPAGSAPAPATADQVQPYLANYQQSQVPGLEVRDSAAIAADLTQKTQVLDAQGNPVAAPTAPKLLETFQGLREEYGVQSLEQSLNDLKKSALDLQAETRARYNNEEGKAVAVGVISGRASEIQRQQSEALDEINRNISYVTDQLNTAYNGINLIMTLTEKDYQLASEAWNAAYQRNVNMIQLVQSQVKLESDLRQQVIDNSRAALNTYLGFLKSGNISYGQLTSDQKLQITKLEVQSGLPPGFSSQIKGDPLATTTLDDGRVMVLTRASDGSIQTSYYGTAKPKAVAPAKFSVTSSVLTKATDILTAIDRTAGNNKGGVDKKLTQTELSAAIARAVNTFGNYEDANLAIESALRAGGWQSSNADGRGGWSLS